MLIFSLISLSHCCLTTSDQLSIFCISSNTNKNSVVPDTFIRNRADSHICDNQTEFETVTASADSYKLGYR